MINQKSPFYITKKFGGLNPCIQGNNRYGLRPFPGSVLPNCEGFTVGYFNEQYGSGSCRYLGNYKYIEDFINAAKKQGLKTGSSPKAGAVLCWGEGSKLHVANVKEVRSSSSIVTIESGWNYTKAPIVRLVERKKGSGNWGHNKKFRCFIYPPEPEYEEYKVKAGDNLTKIAKKFGTTISQIMADNPIIKDKNLIKVGWILKIRKGNV